MARRIVAIPSDLRAQITLAIVGCALVPFTGVLILLSSLLGNSPVTAAGGLLTLAGLLISYVVLSVVVGRVLAERLARPLANMAVEVRGALGVSTVLTRPFMLKTDDPDEVVELKRLLNQMNERVAREIDQRRAILAMVAHDLKTPILGTVRVLEEVQGGSLHGQEWLEGVLDAQNRLLEMVSLLVQAARLESGDVHVPLSLDVVELHEVVRRLVAQAPEYLRSRVRVDGVGSVRGDENLIARALSNVLDNAFRYSRSSITVNVFPGLVRIADDGPGLPDELHALASPFRSVEVLTDGVATPVGMAGLGLFIARRILELHGGRLVVERSSSRGTTLLAYLPT